MRKSYEIDWNKIDSFEDLKLVIGAMLTTKYGGTMTPEIRVDYESRFYEQLYHLRKDDAK